MDVSGSLRERADWHNERSSFDTSVRTMGEILCLAVQRGPTLLGQVPISSIRKAAAQAGISLQTLAYDPGETVRHQRLGLRGWRPDKVARRMRACEAAYQAAKDGGTSFAHQIYDVTAAHQLAAAKRAIELDSHTWEGITAYLCTVLVSYL